MLTSPVKMFFNSRQVGYSNRNHLPARTAVHERGVLEAFPGPENLKNIGFIKVTSHLQMPKKNFFFLI